MYTFILLFMLLCWLTPQTWQRELKRRVHFLLGRLEGRTELVVDGWRVPYTLKNFR